MNAVKVLPYFYNTNGNLQLFTEIEHDYKVNDKVIITKLNNEIEFFINTNNILNRYTILAVPNRNTVILDIPFSSIKKVFDKNNYILSNKHSRNSIYNNIVNIESFSCFESVFNNSTIKQGVFKSCTFNNSNIRSKYNYVNTINANLTNNGVGYSNSVNNNGRGYSYFYNCTFEICDLYKNSYISCNIDNSNLSDGYYENCHIKSGNNLTGGYYKNCIIECDINGGTINNDYICKNPLNTTFNSGVFEKGLFTGAWNGGEFIGGVFGGSVCNNIEFKNGYYNKGCDYKKYLTSTSIFPSNVLFTFDFNNISNDESYENIMYNIYGFDENIIDKIFISYGKKIVDYNVVFDEYVYNFTIIHDNTIQITHDFVNYDNNSKTPDVSYLTGGFNSRFEIYKFEIYYKTADINNSNIYNGIIHCDNINNSVLYGGNIFANNIYNSVPNGSSCDIKCKNMNLCEFNNGVFNTDSWRNINFYGLGFESGLEPNILYCTLTDSQKDFLLSVNYYRLKFRVYPRTTNVYVNHNKYKDYKDYDYIIYDEDHTIVQIPINININIQNLVDKYPEIGTKDVKQFRFTSIQYLDLTYNLDDSAYSNYSNFIDSSFNGGTFLGNFISDKWDDGNYVGLPKTFIYLDEKRFIFENFMSIYNYKYICYTDQDTTEIKLYYFKNGVLWEILEPIGKPEILYNFITRMRINAMVVDILITQYEQFIKRDEFDHFFINLYYINKETKILPNTTTQNQNNL